MIDVYAYGTGNGLRPCVAMAECELEHTVHKVDLDGGENLTPEYLKMNPLDAVPVIVDHDGPGASRWSSASRRRSFFMRLRSPADSCRATPCPAPLPCNG